MKEMYKEPEMELVFQLVDVIRTSYSPDDERNEAGGQDGLGGNTGENNG